MHYYTLYYFQQEIVTYLTTLQGMLKVLQNYVIFEIK